VKPEPDSTQREVAADRLAAHVKRVVDQAPPLTQAQRDRLSALLRSHRVVKPE
jgi:hypothetical protein